MLVLAFDDLNVVDVNTDDHLPAQYTPGLISTFDLLALTALASIRKKDARALAAIASRSAAINDQFLPRRHGSSLANLQRLVPRVGALGIAIGHTGTAAALLFPGDDVDLPNQLQLAEDELSGLGCKVLMPPFKLGA